MTCKYFIFALSIIIGFGCSNHQNVTKINPNSVSFGQRCNAFLGLSIPANMMSLKTNGALITQANLKEDETKFRYCEIKGAIKPLDASASNINFQINLPILWNKKGLHFGGAGYNGLLVTGLEQAKFNPENALTPLQRGYATWGSDSGHQGELLEGHFLLNKEELRNYGGEQLKKTYDIAMLAINLFYQRRPEYVYFQGSSQGGHESMIAIQRWPNAYSGAIVVHPANSFVGLQLSGNRAAQAFYLNDAYLSHKDVELLNGKIFRVCDMLDGAKDGIVSNTQACEKNFSINTLRCADGLPKNGECFGNAQINALNTLNSRADTPLLQGGAKGFAGFPIYLGADLYGLWGMGTSAKALTPPKPLANLGLHVLADPFIRYGVLQEPETDTLTFTQKNNEKRITELSQLIDALSPDLSAFTNRGGKILLMHGTTDFAIPFQNTIDWYKRVVGFYGQTKTDEFMYFSLVPGFGHGSGVFQARWDSLLALEAWVEQGIAPKNLTVTDAAKETKGRTRPLCKFPRYPRLNKGAKDLNSATSYSCVM